MNEPRPSPWLAVLAGVAGGAAAGAVDILVTLLRGVGGVTGMHSVRLVMIGIGAGGLAGAALAGMAGWLSRRGGPQRGADRGAMAAAVLLGGPFVVYDAFALFAGPKAARMPAHGAISVVLALVGLAALAGLGRLFARRGEGRWLPALVVGVVAAACYWANRTILPRLYPWFHVTLSVAFLALVVIAARLAVGRRPGERTRAWALAGLGGVALLFAIQLTNLIWSPIIRYAAHERTLLTGALVRVLPAPKAPEIPRFASHEPDQPQTPLPEGPHRPNADVLLITIDALRADHVGAYGYPRNTTPNLDALARRGVRFERAYTQAPHTSFSVASMLTGKYYPTIARLGPGDAHDPITDVLRRYGWKTAAFYPPAVFYVDGHKLKAYQDNNFRFEYVKFEYLDARKRLDQIDAFFKTDRPGKTFLWLHLFEPHEPYDTRPGHDFGKSDIDRYDSEIAYTDAAVGELVAYFEKNRPGAIIIVTADHGEEFDEHGGRYHGTSLYEEQVRVPLVVVVPGVAPHVVPGPVELIDLAPTILGLVDIPAPARIRGTDLGPWLAEPGAPASRLPPAFAEVADKRMIAWGSEKLICEMNWGYCAYYDLVADPREQKNLAEQAPERAARLKHRLDDWLDDHVRFEPQLVKGRANPDGSAVPKAIERGRLGDLLAMGDLAALLQSNQPLPVRREAARLLVALPPRAETAAGVRGAVNDTDEEVRDWASVAAARLGDPGGRDRTRALLGRPADQVEGHLRVQAALALARAKDPTGVPVLAGALSDCSQDVLGCQLIILELGKLRDRRAVPALLAHLPEVQNRREMVQALGAIGDPTVAGALVDRLTQDEYVPVRVEAARALALLGGEEARAGLERSLRDEKEPAVQAAAREALRKLEPSSRPPARRDTARSPRPGATR